ncbi:MAG: PqqD family protein [Blastocatellia bacterium]|nr:PqqD family protein [Blastocatellia bacterium]
MNNSQFPVARRNGLVVQEVPDEVLVYDLDSNKAHCLNKTAALVWKSCNGSNTISDISKLVESEAGGSVSGDIVWLAIDQLSENGLLETQINSKFAGQSRREVIKKIGLASMVAIPVIASLVAPQNALAVGSCNCSANSACAATLVSCPATTCDSGTNGSFTCIPSSG